MFDEIIQTLPATAGSYILWQHLSQRQDLTVGRLGTFSFPAGDYLYLGSAFGSGGLRARLGRHLRGKDKRHWHIDHLREAAKLRGYGFKIPSQRDPIRHIPPECDWSQKLIAIPEISIPVPGFGASDCQAGCGTHLVYIMGLDVQEISKILNCKIYILSDRGTIPAV